MEVEVTSQDQKEAIASRSLLHMAYTSKLLCFVLVAFLVASASEARKRNQTHIQFYMHDTPGGPNASAVRVAGQPINATGSNNTDASMFGFGSIYVMDNSLTATPDINSTLIGRAQGLYAMASQENELSLHMTLTYNFVSGIYNGSSVSVVGRNPVMNEVREMPVVGGTGVFRLARGFALAKTHSMNQWDAIIEYNVTIIPYY